MSNGINPTTKILKKQLYVYTSVGGGFEYVAIEELGFGRIANTMALWAGRLENLNNLSKVTKNKSVPAMSEDLLLAIRRCDSYLVDEGH